MKKLRVEEQRLKAQPASSSMAGIGGDKRRTLWDFVTRKSKAFPRALLSQPYKRTILSSNQPLY